MEREKLDKTGKFEKFAPIVPIAIGFMIVKGSKKKSSDSMKFLGFGLAGGGGAKLAGNFIPPLAGIEEIDLSGIFGEMRIGQTLNDDLRLGNTLNDDIDGMDDEMNDEVSDEMSDEMADDVSGYGDY